jgi:SAM-dependent methyltransferase
MGKVEFHPRRAWKTLWSPLPRPTPIPASGSSELKSAYVNHVAALTQSHPYDEAMELAIGGGFREIGAIEAALVRHFGANGGYLIDVGCGSGRLAKPLSSDPGLRYLGVDLVPDLVAYAQRICARPDWRFEVIDHIGIPEADGQADMVCFFSVLTHLLHDQSYWYLEEARRVLKPGGRIVFSFLEFAEAGHLPIFRDTVAAARARVPNHMNVFIERNAIEVWARELGMDLIAVHAGGDHLVAEGNLGQALAVLRKPA